MNYATYFLKFPTEQEANLALEEAGYKRTYTDIDGEEKFQYIVPDTKGDIDVVGEIYANDAVTGIDDEGYPIVITPATKLDGWHVNIILDGKLPEVLSDYVVTPSNPHRVFA
jgi:hypothetical protein